MERGLADDGDTPDIAELNAKLESIDNDQDLENIFPSTFAALTDGVDSGGGIRINLGSDDPGLPAQYVPEDEIDEDEDVYLFTEKNIHGSAFVNSMASHRSVDARFTNSLLYVYW